MRYDPSWPVIPVISATLNGRDGGGFCPFEADSSVAIVEEEREKWVSERGGGERERLELFLRGERDTERGSNGGVGEWDL